MFIGLLYAHFQNKLQKNNEQKINHKSQLLELKKSQTK
jgi:hypothetical protein